MEGGEINMSVFDIYGRSSKENEFIFVLQNQPGSSSVGSVLSVMAMARGTNTE